MHLYMHFYVDKKNLIVVKSGCHSARRRAAVGSTQHGGMARGAAVPMEAGGGSRWKSELGADGETKMGRVTK
jgi:hypothetical protein